MSRTIARVFESSWRACDNLRNAAEFAWKTSVIWGVMWRPVRFGGKFAENKRSWLFLVSRGSVTLFEKRFKRREEIRFFRRLFDKYSLSWQKDRSPKSFPLNFSYLHQKSSPIPSFPKKHLSSVLPKTQSPQATPPLPKKPTFHRFSVANNPPLVHPRC
jgi:hypothetical protein